MGSVGDMKIANDEDEDHVGLMGATALADTPNRHLSLALNPERSPHGPQSRTRLHAIKARVRLLLQFLV